MVVRTAQQLFMEHGYRNVSTRQIADVCGLTQPTLYHYFANKQELYIAVVEQEIAQARIALERIARRDESVEERLRHVAHYLLSISRDLALMLHDIREDLDLPVQKTLNDSFHVGMLGPIASIFEDGLQAGILRDQDQGGVDAMTATYLFLNLLAPLKKETTTLSMPHSGLSTEVVCVLLYGLASDHSPQERMKGKIL